MENPKEPYVGKAQTVKVISKSTCYRELFYNTAGGDGHGAMLIVAGFDCYTWMCAGCSYASFCDRTCGFEACDCGGDGAVDEEYCAHMAAIAASSGR
jgi:hypothetical protein